jgi:hypothetical protein
MFGSSTARAPWEPTMGANALRLSSTDPDPAGPLLQVRGSLLDSLRPGQTPDSCLGVKGSPVQIRPSRLVFRTLVPRNGNETGHDHSHLGLSALTGCAGVIRSCPGIMRSWPERAAWVRRGYAQFAQRRSGCA